MTEYGITKLSDDLIELMCETVSIGATYKDTALSVGISPITLNTWIRIGNHVDDLINDGLSPQESSVAIGIGINYAIQARQLYLKLGEARARCNVRALRSLDKLIEGYETELPSRVPDLSAIKLRLSMAEGYSPNDATITHTVGANRNSTVIDVTAHTLSDLKDRKLALRERAGITDRIESDSEIDSVGLYARPGEE